MMTSLTILSLESEMERVFYAKTRQTDRRPTRGSALSMTSLFSSSSGVTSRSYCIVCVYIYIRVYLYVRTSVDYTAYCMVGNKTTGRPYNKPSSSFTGFCPPSSLFFYLIPSRRIVCVPSFGLFHSLFPSRRLFSPQSNPSQSYRASHFQWPPKCLKLVLLFIFSLSLSFSPSLSSCRTKRNLSHSLSFSRRRFCPRDGSSRT